MSVQKGPVLTAVVILSMFAVASAAVVMLSEEQDASVIDFSDDYYYNALPDKEQAVYRTAYASILGFDKEIDTGVTGDILKEYVADVLASIRYDHPELFYLGKTYTYNTGTGILKPSYELSQADYRSVKNTIDSEFADAVLYISDLSRKASVDDINEYLFYNVVYDDEAAADSEGYRYAHDIRGVFINGKAVCEGYALAFKYFCDYLGIPCICVVGNAGSDPSDMTGHMWNYVQMGSRWYAMDATWNDPDSTVPILVPRTDYTLVGSDTVIGGKKFCVSHQIDNISAKYGVPEIEKSKYSSTTGQDTLPDYSDAPHYYYDKLTAAGKKAYDSLVAGAIKFDEVIPSGTTDFEVMNDAASAIRLERQDLFQLNEAHIIMSGASGGQYKVTYTITKSQYENMCSMILDAMKPLNKELAKCGYTYDKVKVIHDFLVKNLSYLETKDCRNIYGALVNKQCVCEGYARSMQYLCAMSGIEAICVRGTGINDTGSEGHMWNLIHMNDGKWYNMDVTWDDPVIIGGIGNGEVRYNYFLVGLDSVYKDRTFAQSHVLDMSQEGHPASVINNNSVVPETSHTDYYIRPGTNPLVTIDVDASVVGDSFVATVGIEVIEDLMDRTQGMGSGFLKMRTYGYMVGLDSTDGEMLLDYMRSNSLDIVKFVVSKRSDKVGIGPVALSNDVYSLKIAETYSYIEFFSIGRGFEPELGVPFTPGNLDIIKMLIFGWDAEKPYMPVTGSHFQDDYVLIPVSSDDQAFAVGSTPIKGVSVIILIAAIILLLLVIVAIRRHGKKKRAKTDY